MNKIKFSHKYEKFPMNVEIDETLLLEVFCASKKELSENFIRYDTGYIEHSFFEEDDDFKQYSLPPGKLLVLILITYCDELVKPRLWTTVRRWTPEKEKYYRSVRGQQVEIVIEETK